MKKHNLFPLSILLLLPCIYFWRIVFLGESLFEGDIITVNYPLRVFVRECLREGIIPLWCPYLYSGFPLLAEGQAGVFYPLNLLLFTLFEPNFAFNTSVILHFFLAGLFMFLYLRIITQDRWSALFAGITFMFSGLFITHLTYFNRLTIYVWLPLIFYLIELSFRKKNLKYTLLTGVIFGIQFLGVEPQISLQILFVVPIYFLFRVFNQKVYGAILNLFIIFIIGFGLFAIQLFPMYELLKESQRGSPLPYEMWTLASLSLPQSITFILPDFWGNVFKGIYVGDWNYIDLCGYLGLMPLISGLIAVVLRRDKYTFCFLGICLLGLLLAMGKYNPLYNLLYHLPITSSVRYPGRYLYLYTFGMSVLAGLGFNYLLAKSQTLLRTIIFTSICFGLIGIFAICQIQLEKPIFVGLLYLIRIKDWLLFIIIGTLSFSLLILYLKQKITPAIFISLSILLLIANIFIYWSGFNPTVKKSEVISIPESVNFLKKDTTLYRVTTHNWSKEFKDPIARSNLTKLKPFKGVMTLFKESICPNLPALYRISSIDGFLGLPLIRYMEFTQILNFKLLSLANGKYIITSKDIHLPPPLVFSNSAVNIFENEYCFPRAFVVHRARVIKDKEKILQELRSEHFRPSKYVILEEEAEAINGDKPGGGRQEAEDRRQEKRAVEETKEQVQIIKYSPNEVNLKVRLSKPGFLILTDTYYPGWEVYVNGKKERIYRADFLFRAVHLKSAGDFSLRFVYNPASFNIGAAITLFTIILVGLWYIILVFVSRKCKKEMTGISSQVS